MDITKITSVQLVSFCFHFWDEVFDPNDFCLRICCFELGCAAAVFKISVQPDQCEIIPRYK